MDHREILAGLIVLLYLSDCLRLLEPGQAALATSALRGWRVRFGSNRMGLAGKDPLLANPFDPGEILFAVRWRASGAPGQGAGVTGIEQVRTAAAELAAPGWLCWVSGVLAVALLPVLLLLPSGPVPIVVCAGALYLNIAITGLVIHARRERLGAPPGLIAKVWAESILCAPFGPNMARKVAWALPTKDSSLALLAGQLLDDRRKAQAWEQCRERVAELKAEFDEGTAAYAALDAEEARWRNPS